MSKKIIGDVNLSNWHLEQLPEILKDVSIDGHFYCVGNRLISLINAPSSVKRDFYCAHNKLTSLTGAPKTVGNNFYCAHNKLTSLDGAPKTVGGSFSCNNNPVKFTEEQVRAVCNVKGKIFV